MKRLLADANVLVSIALTRSPDAPSALIYDAALAGDVELITSPMVLGELASVLRRPRLRRFIELDDAERYVVLLAATTTVVADVEPPYPAICRDPDDDYLLAIARREGVECIVSGDHDLLELDNPPLPILTPRQALELLA